MADNTSKTFNTKQKVIAGITVIIFCFIIYEVIGLFPSNKATTPVATAKPTHPAQMSANLPARAAAPLSPAAMQPTSEVTTVTTVNAITPSPKENVDLQKQEQQQQTYLESVNQLQLLKVKREIAETNQAIASARLATETANKNMSDLLTQPAPLPPAAGGTDISKLTGVNTLIPGQPSENIPTPKPQMDIPFAVISVSMQFNRWKAILSYQDKLYSVSTGDTLFDGSKVASITKNGVTLVKDGKRRKISIQTSI